MIQNLNTSRMAKAALILLVKEGKMLFDFKVMD